MRASRLVSVLLLLQARGRLTADALAAELEVSVRTIYRDIEALQLAGVPLYGEPGHDGGYRLVGGYRTQLTGLTRDEAAALWLMALPGPAGELGFGDAATAAATKVRASLGDELGLRADAVRQRLHVDSTNWYAEPIGTPYLTQVADAVWRQQRLRVQYRRWKAPTDVERELDPYGLVLKGGRWYLVAGSSDQTRTYRVSQLLDVHTTDVQFERPSAFDLVGHWQGYLADFATRRHVAQARVRVSARGLDRMAHVLDPATVQLALAGAGPPDDEGWVTTTVPIESVRHAHDELLRLGAEIEVLAPRELRDRLAETARELVRRYGGAGSLRA